MGAQISGSGTARSLPSDYQLVRNIFERAPSGGGGVLSADLVHAYQTYWVRLRWFNVTPKQRALSTKEETFMLPLTDFVEIAQRVETRAAV